MSKFLSFLFLVLAINSQVKGQYYCKDSTLIEPYYRCGIYAGGEDYKPVCGCDGITYRNECAAIHWGGLLQNAWVTETVCENFGFDFRPTAISYQSVSNQPARLQFFIKNPNHTAVGVSVYIYDVWGKVWYSWVGSTGTDGLYPFTPMELPLQPLKMGIYVLAVVVNGEQQTIKFAKMTNDD